MKIKTMLAVAVITLTGCAGLTPEEQRERTHDVVSIITIPWVILTGDTHLPNTLSKTTRDLVFRAAKQKADYGQKEAAQLAGEAETQKLVKSGQKSPKTIMVKTVPREGQKGEAFMEFDTVSNSVVGDTIYNKSNGKGEDFDTVSILED